VAIKILRFVKLACAMRSPVCQNTVVLLALIFSLASPPAVAVIIESVDGSGNVSEPSSAAGTTHGHESGYVSITAKRSSDQAVVWQGTLTLDGSVLDFDASGTPSQFGTGTIEDFSLVGGAQEPFTLLQPYGGHDEVTVESLIIKSGAGFATSLGFPIGPNRWSLTASPIEFSVTYSAVDTGGGQAAVFDQTAPLSTGSLVGTLELVNGQIEVTLTCAVTTTLDGSAYGESDLEITGDITWFGSHAAAVPDPGWNYIGRRGGNTAVYIGDGWVLTANHVGVGDLELGGVTYPYVPGSGVQLENNDQSPADMLVFKVSPDPGLPPLPLRTSFPSPGLEAIMIGNGRDRGITTSFDPAGSNPPIEGWEWAPGRSVRWGTNQIDGFPSSKLLDNFAVYTAFDSGQSVHEAQASDGDSGGALFVDNNGSWELAGILYAVGAFPQQPGSTAIYGNVTYAARVDYYYDEIQDAIALPEPSGSLGLLLGTGLVATLNHRRKGRASSPD